MPVRTLDYTALTTPATRADIAAYRAQARASGAPWARSNSTGTIVGAVIVLVVFLFIGAGLFSSLIAQGLSVWGHSGSFFPLLFLVVIAVGIVLWARARRTRGGTWGMWLQLDRFAHANGLVFTPRDVAPSYPGEIFQVGHDQTTLAHLESAAGASGGHFLDLGNFAYVTGSGRDRTTHYWGFMALALDRAMPNIVLDSKANNGFFGSNLPAVLDRKQVLQLEGDFDKYFTLYCPKEYEQDALYIFTPDLMALLIDEAAPYDVELVDQWMFVYSSKPFAITDPATLQRLFTIADTVGAKALSQTAHYADDRVGDPAANIVAPQGARLKRGVSVIGIAIVVAFAVFWGWNFFGGILGAVFGSR